MPDPLPQPVATSRPLWPLILALTMLGLVLRVAAAQGDYWLDEAWSAVFAREAATVGDVLFAVNHDNNHYLNTLWLRIVGWGGSPLLGRSLSILCGTLAIPVAGAIGLRRGRAVAIATAALFAVSPMLVTYGSEARGYAPMLLCLLISFAVVDRVVAGDPPRRAGEALGLAALIGTFAHVSMLFGVAALTGWVAIAMGREKKKAWPALLATFKLMGRAIAGVGAVLAMIAAGAIASPIGLRMGNLTPFEPVAFVDSLDHMIGFGLGLPWLISPFLPLILLLPFALRRVPALRDRMPFHLIAILGLPLLVLIFEPDNSAFPRYYLLSATGLLLLIPELLKLWPRLAAVGIAILFLGSLAADVHLADNQRADPGIAVDLIAARSPGGAVVLLETMRDGAVLEAAAARRAYGLLTSPQCVRADYYFVQANIGGPLPIAGLRCGAAFRPLALGRVYGLSGMDWQLYERVR